MNIFKKRLFGLVKKLKFLPPEFYAGIFYEYYNDKKLNLEDPVDFNEKLQWLKVYYHPDILNKLVDKYEVRDYVKAKVGGEYLNELLGLYNRISEIDYEALPSQFVLKTTHGYNNNIIVRDKDQLNKTKASLLLRKWMLRNQYYNGGQEWAYKDVPHRIIAEKYLPELDREGVSDYKFYCFNGNAEFIEVTIQVNARPKRRYYDLEWKNLEMARAGQPNYEHELEKPEKLEKMIAIAQKLANGFPFVRVDLYNLDGKILFGELTFYPADARYPFLPESYNQVLGKKIILPRLPPGRKEIKEI